MTTNAIYHCKNYPVKVTSRVVTPVSGFIELVSVYYEDNVMTIHHPHTIPSSFIKKQTANTQIVVCNLMHTYTEA